MSKICFGCGAKLQSQDEEKEGYVIESKLESAKYCKRCFRMMHYGENKSAAKPKKTSEIIKAVNKHASLTVFCTDFINIFDEIIDIYKSITSPKIFVVTKCDIIPQNISFRTIRSHLEEFYGIEENIIFVSNKSSLNTLIRKIYGIRDVYFLGLTNSGKSTLINAIASKLGAKSIPLTTSYKENTTLDFVRVSLDKSSLVDSPGFVIPNYDVDKFTNINEKIKPITYQKVASCTFALEGLFSVYVEGNSDVTFYLSKSVKITRFYKKMSSGVSLEVPPKCDVVICGLGFVSIKSRARITIPEDIEKYIHIRPRMSGAHHE